MNLYHASKKVLSFLEPRQAMQGENVPPEDELLKGVYLTPHYDFALAMGARPDNSSTRLDENERKITFEKPELFDPNQEIYIYTVDTDLLPKEHVKFVDDHQYVIIGEEKILPSDIQKVKAEELLKYYELTNWKRTIESKKEGGMSFKMR